MDIRKLTRWDLCEYWGYHVREIDWLCRNIKDQYKARKHFKKDGTPRQIYRTRDRLKRIQRGILKLLENSCPLPNHFHGSVKGRSAKTNAESHCGKEVVINIDIKDYFPSISSRRINKTLLNIGVSKSVANLLTRLTTFNGFLPQGASTSNYLANLVFANSRAYRRLSSLCKKHGFDFTVYVDDLTFSGPVWLERFSDKIIKILKEDDFQVNHSKTRVMHCYERQEVTGVCVNKKVNVKQEYVREIKSRIYRFEKFGEMLNSLDKRNELRVIRGMISHVHNLSPNKALNLLHYLSS